MSARNTAQGAPAATRPGAKAGECLAAIAAAAVLDEILYAYDRDGNRTRRVTRAGTEDYTYDSGSRLRQVLLGGVPIAEYGYDGAGRVTRIARGGGARDLGWDADDHVTSVAAGLDETRFDFDAQGRRVRAEHRTAGTTTGVHRYVVGPTLAESLESPHLVTDDAGAPEAGWVFAGEHPLLRYDPATGQIVYYLQDAMGSTIALADDAASTATLTYDGFGALRSTTGSLADLPPAAGGDFRFQGMWLDHGTGLYYVRARTYEPDTGRFLSRDPVTGVPEAAESYHPYAFARGNPPFVRDPSGAISLADVLADTVVERILATIAVSTFGAGLLRGLQAANQVEREITDDRLTAFAECIERHTVDAEIAGATLGVGIPVAPIEKARAVALGLLERTYRLERSTRLTSLTSVLITRLTRALELATTTVIRARQFARGVSNVTTPLLVGEGFYDVGLVAGCTGVFF